MSYDPSFYSPYKTVPNWLYQPATSTTGTVGQPINGLVRIEGVEGGKMYPLPPNSVSPPLFLADENAFLVKTTDGGGAATLKKYVFEEAALEPDSSDKYVTREYFDDWANRIMEAINGKHPVPEQQQQLAAKQNPASTTARPV